MGVMFIGMSAPRIHGAGAHRHDAWEIVVNTRGSGYTDIGGKRYGFSAGTIICHPPRVAHSKYSDEGFHDIFLQPTAFGLTGGPDKNDVLVFQDDTSRSFETLMQMAHRTYHRKDENHRRVLDALYEAMLQMLVGWRGDAAVEDDVERLQNRLVNGFTDGELSVSALLAEGPYCADHLRRRFKQATGQTPAAYLAALRLAYAKKLLRENDSLHYGIAEIGAMAGYYDSRYFARVFKESTGVTPQAYAKRG